jgi:hypothetical protein
MNREKIVEMLEEIATLAKDAHYRQDAHDRLESISPQTHRDYAQKAAEAETELEEAIQKTANAIIAYTEQEKTIIVKSIDLSRQFQ